MMVQVVDAPPSTEPAATTEEKPKQKQKAKKRDSSGDATRAPPVGVIKKIGRFNKLCRYVRADGNGGDRVTYVGREPGETVVVQIVRGEQSHDQT